LRRATPAEKTEGIVECRIGEGFVKLCAPMCRRAVDPHAPSRAMPIKIGLLISRHGFVRHILEVVVARIVGAHVIEAEMEILSLATASLRRTVKPTERASGMSADGFGLSRGGILAALARADAIEKRRIQIHGYRDYVA